MNAQNIVLAGLWYGSKKPPMHLLLKPIMKKLHHLYTLGVPIQTPHDLVIYRAKIESCTANTHLLFHLPKYVRLWGPLWTHPAFGKNDHLKRLIHGRGNVVPQLLFNIDVSQTLQLMHHELAQHESEQTMNFLNTSSQIAPRSNMTQVDEHMYIVGPCHVKSLTDEQCTALGTEEPMPCFYKLYKDGVLYHTTSRFSTEIHGKRDSTVCAFKTSDNKKHFGRLVLFVNTPSPQALVREFHQPPQSLLKQAGPPCRPALAMYKDVDLLNSFITVVEEVHSTPLLAIPIVAIQGKMVFVKNEVSTYVIKQPNQYEHHYQHASFYCHIFFEYMYRERSRSNCDI